MTKILFNAVIDNNYMYLICCSHTIVHQSTMICSNTIGPGGVVLSHDVVQIRKVVGLPPPLPPTMVCVTLPRPSGLTKEQATSFTPKIDQLYKRDLPIFAAFEATILSLAAFEQLIAP